MLSDFNICNKVNINNPGLINQLMLPINKLLVYNGLYRTCFIVYLYHTIVSYFTTVLVIINNLKYVT